MTLDILQSEQLMKTCHELLTTGMNRSLVDVFDAVDDTLFELIKHSGPKEQRDYFGALREIRRKRKAIETRFKQDLSANLNYGQSTETPVQAPIKVSGPSAELDKEGEESLALQLAQERIGNTCHQALATLDQRMRTLLAKELSDDENCYAYPERLCAVFKNACTEIESDIEVRLILFKLFERYVANALQTACVAMDKFMHEYEDGDEKYKKSIAPTPQPIITDRDAEEKNYYLIAKHIVSNQIQKHTSGAEVPEFVIKFIDDHWSKLLFKIQLRDSKDTKAWDHAIEVIDDLIRCVDPLQGKDASIHSVEKFAQLVQRLRYGMNVIPVPSEERDQFILKLGRYHESLLATKASETHQDRGNDKADKLEIPIPDGFGTQKSDQNVPFVNELFVDK